MKIIRLIAFRGTGFRGYEHEHPLIRAGHVGIQFEGEDEILGFHPTDEAIRQAGGNDAALSLLGEDGILAGTVQHDTEIFVRAYELAQQGERTVVWELAYEFSDAEFERISDTLRQWYDEQRIFVYKFPELTEGTYNCATFPSLLGIPIPEPSGRLAAYIAALENLAVRWAPKRNQ